MKHTAKLLFIVLTVAIVVIAFSFTIMAKTNGTVETPNFRIVNADDIVLNSEHEIGYNFNDFQRAMYNELRGFIKDVTNGETTSTILRVRVDISSFEWEKYTVTDNMSDLIDLETVDIWRSLVASCPFDFFWRGWVVGCSWSEVDDFLNAEYFEVEFSILVSEDYCGENIFSVSPEAIAAGRAAAKKAQEIVNKYQDSSDLEKLQSYIDEIAELTSYGRSGDYGANDNLVYVFDEDPQTTVACEGYAKAFKYLCDLSTFDKDIYCHIAAGENHMWNVVEIDGNNYLVDVTWYDTVDGHPYTEYFLAGGVSSSDGQTMTIKGHIGHTDTRSYDESERDRHCAGYLILSETRYHEHKYSDTWISDDTHHWHECSCGDKIDTSAHTSDENISISCTQGAVCGVCAAEYGEPIPHAYDQQNLQYLKDPATCTESAQYYYSCECGKTGTDFFSYGEPNSHSYDANGVCASCGDVIVVDKPTETPDVDDNCGNVGTDDDASDAEDNKDDTPDIDVSPDLDDQIDAPSDNGSNNDTKGSLLDRFIELLIEFLIEFIKFLFA